MTKVLFLYKSGRTARTGSEIVRRLMRLGLEVVGVGGSSRRDVELLIRWGNSDPFPSKKELNKREGVIRASNKQAALKVLGEGRVRVPNFKEGMGPAIGRKRNHQQGRDIRVYGEGEKLEGSDYYLEIIPSDKEFRVHVFKGEVLVTQKKVLPGRELPQEKVPLRNHDKGWRFIRIRERPVLSSVAIKAVKVLGLDFGAVDIIKDRRNNNYVVLEVNTAPALELTSLDRWVERFRKEIADDWASEGVEA